MTFTDIENAIYDWVSSVSGITTIFSHQNAPRPTSLYALINVISDIQISEPETISTPKGDGTVDIIYSAQKEVTISLNTFYSGAFATIQTIRDSLHKLETIESLFSDGLGFKNATAVQRVPDILEELWEERGQFDVTFFYRSEVAENVETIEKIQLTNEIDDTTTIIQ